MNCKTQLQNETLIPYPSILNVSMLCALRCTIVLPSAMVTYQINFKDKFSTGFIQILILFLLLERRIDHIIYNVSPCEIMDYKFAKKGIPPGHSSLKFSDLKFPYRWKQFFLVLSLQWGFPSHMWLGTYFCGQFWCFLFDSAWGMV